MDRHLRLKRDVFRLDLLVREKRFEASTWVFLIGDNANVVIHRSRWLVGSGCRRESGFRAARSRPELYLSSDNLRDAVLHTLFVVPCTGFQSAFNEGERPLREVRCRKFCELTPRDYRMELDGFLLRACAISPCAVGRYAECGYLLASRRHPHIRRLREPPEDDCFVVIHVVGVVGLCGLW